ncbi:MAG: alpha/beta fold hydrolase [Pseudomonadota bacterium]
MQLHFRQSGSEHNPPLLFLHGLFGSAANWGRIVRHFEADYHCIIPDLRNHGRSAHHPDVSYKAQAEDVHELMQALSLRSAHLVAHSMGGKAAMTLALTQPGAVRSLVVVDIAPVRYKHSFSGIIDALRQLDLQLLQNRDQADSQLAASIPDAAIRAYLLQNLVKRDGQWHWRINLNYLHAGIGEIIGFPEMKDHLYPGDTLFLYGERSGYLDQNGSKIAKLLFPRADFVEVGNAGHWVYAENPVAFIRHVEEFIDHVKPGRSSS